MPNLRVQLLDSKYFYPDEPRERRQELASAIVLESDNPLEASSEELSFEFEQINGALLDIRVEATESGDLLRFRNAILAVVETNKNNDDISKENIDELAATLSGRAVDINHDERANAGIITAARSVIYKGKPAVAIDGLGWRDRYPEEWDGVRAGTHHLSVEADAAKATCSNCKGEFVSAALYCDHLKNRRRSGAKRGFIGLKGKGAGITTNPAGTGTQFDRDQIFVVAHQEPELEASWYDSLLPEGKTIDDLPASDFADPAGRRFPYKINGKVNERGWRAAYSAARGGHTGKEDKSAVEKLLRDKPDGVDVQGSIKPPIEQVAPYQEIKIMSKCPHCGKEVAARDGKCPDCGKSMTAELLAVDLKAAEEKVAEATATLAVKDGELKSALSELESLKAATSTTKKVKAEEPGEDPNEEKTETKRKENLEEKDAEDIKLKKAMTAMQVDLEARTAELSTKATELETAKAALDEANHKLAEIKANQREAEIKPLMTAEAWTERSASFLAMDDNTFATVAASLKEVAKKPAQAIGLKSGMPEPVAGSDNGRKISLR